MPQNNATDSEKQNLNPPGEPGGGSSGEPKPEGDNGVTSEESSESTSSVETLTRELEVKSAALEKVQRELEAEISKREQARKESIAERERRQKALEEQGEYKTLLEERTAELEAARSEIEEMKKTLTEFEETVTAVRTKEEERRKELAADFPDDLREEVEADPERYPLSVVEKLHAHLSSGGTPQTPKDGHEPKGDGAPDDPENTPFRRAIKSRLGSD